jgi:Phage P22-like portal protein
LGLKTPTDHMQQARDRFASAKRYWSRIFDEARKDFRMVYGDQWDERVRSEREDANRPALQFNAIASEVQRAANQARQDRPSIKVNPCDDEANEKASEFLADKIRHIQYASEASSAYDYSVECSMAGSVGCLRVTTEYVDDRSFNQEPRIKRILDPLTVYWDPNCEEPDFSDAKFCFVRQRMKRDEFRDKYGRDPVGWDASDAQMAGPNGWGNDEDNVWVAEYWNVDIVNRRLVQLTDGRVGFDDELDGAENKIVNSRVVEERHVTCELIDGDSVLEDENSGWVGQWIPLVPVLGKEAVVDGERVFISMARNARDPQKKLNAAESGIAENIGVSSRPYVLGAKGQFKDQTWADPTINRPYREYDPAPAGVGQIAQPPQLINPEPPIQALTATALQARDAVRNACGYFDNVAQPSRQDLSGVAVLRRSNQADLTNYHFEDNLTRAQWHLGRILIDLIQKTADTPRVMKAMKVDGSVYSQPITTDDQQPVSGYQGQPHLNISSGLYEPIVEAGPSYATKKEEERDVILQMLPQDPALWPAYAPLIFKLMGYDEAYQLALALAPPPVQAILGGKSQAAAAQAQALVPQLQQKIAMLQQGLQKALTMLQQKQVEAQNRLDVQKLKTIGDVMVEDMKHKHEAALETQSDRMEAIQNLTQMLHESELGQTPGPGIGNNALPQPVQPQGVAA